MIAVFQVNAKYIDDQKACFNFFSLTKNYVYNKN